MSIYGNDIQLEAQASDRLAKFTLEVALSETDETKRTAFLEPLFEQAKKNRFLRKHMKAKRIQKSYGHLLPIERIESLDVIDQRRKAA